MARKLVKKELSILEDIVIESVRRVGLDLKKEQSLLLMRLIFSSISKYFFLEPDSIIDVGFMRFKKNPAKDELFAVEILRNSTEGVVNADTLCRYYKGELAKEAELKNILNGFMDELIEYSQVQEVNINKITSSLSRKRK